MKVEIISTECDDPANTFYYHKWFRAEVKGGWMVTHVYNNGESSIFVPDHMGEWNLDNG